MLIHTSSALRCLSVVYTLGAAVACGPGALFDVPDPVCVRTVVADVEVPTQQAADVLIVVDNSGSMAEEQENLAQNFLNQNAAECPLQDLTDIPIEYVNPPRALYTGNGPLARCGMIQLIAAFDNDFRVGVITSDVGLCDNRLPTQGPPGWGHHPQRGCLQPDAPPGGGGRKVIARADLLDEDASNDDFAARFAATLNNIGVVGSPLERGLDAATFFLDPQTNRHPDCANDLTSFRRPEAGLVVIFLSDENDCSHGIGDGLVTFGDENAGEVCGEFPAHYIPPSPPSGRCYTDPDALPPVSAYVDALLAREPELKVAVIAGAVGEDDTPSGCIVGADGAPDPTCFPSGGLSNFTDPGSVCAADTADARGGLPCCVADAGDRYYDLAEQLGRGATDSICNSSFRETMLDIAAFIAAVDSVLLAEPPDSPGAIVVELQRVGTDEPTPLRALDEGEECANVTGYRLEDNRVVLCGDARPGPGDDLRIRARASAESETCAEPRFEASGGGRNCGAAGVPFAMVLLGVLLRRRRGRVRC